MSETLKEKDGLNKTLKLIYCKHNIEPNYNTTSEDK